MEFAWLEGWLCDLGDAVRRRLEKSNPTIRSERLAALSEIDTINSDGYTWIYIGGKIRFVVRNRDGVILEAEGGTIKGKHQYGKIGEWERWDWESYYPIRKESYWDYLVERQANEPKKRRAARQ